MGMNNFTGNNNGNNGNPPGLPPGSQILGQMPGQTAADPKEWLINYNERFKTAGTILFRDMSIQQTLSVLIGKNKPNALLIGPAGVGKTKIVEDIAYRIESGDDIIPQGIKDHIIYELPLSNIVAGSGIVGELESKIKSVIDFIEDPKEKAILFIDEIHQLVTSSNPTYQKIAQILKPALARGKMKVIGATTTQEAKNLDDDPAFNRRFTQLIINELSPSETLEILKNCKGGYFAHYKNKINISDDILATVVRLADQYRPAGSHRPDNALTLLDRACGDTIINRQVQIALAKKQNNQAILNAINSVPIIPLTEKQIKNTAIRIATGNAKPESLDVDALKDALSRIKGQDDILDKLIRVLRENELNLFQNVTKTKKPTTMMFVGPSGVGKTEVTKIIAEHLTGTKPIVLNMTEYNSPAAINRIIGSPAGYIGYDSHAELPFDCLKSNPYQIILLDEFEKGHPSVQRLFMQAFDQGYITTSRGNTVDFSKCIIIATTNAGQTTGVEQIGITAKPQTSSTKVDTKVLSKYFDIELINRFEPENRIQFHSISKDTYREIVQEMYKDAIAKINITHPRLVFKPEIPDEDMEEILKNTYAKEFGARPAESAVRKYTLSQVL